jgi:hypothetical protein
MKHQIIAERKILALDLFPALRRQRALASARQRIAFIGNPLRTQPTLH